MYLFLIENKKQKKIIVHLKHCIEEDSEAMPGLRGTECQCHILCLLLIYYIQEEVIILALNLSHVRKYYLLPSLNIILEGKTKQKYKKERKKYCY